LINLTPRLFFFSMVVFHLRPIRRRYKLPPWINFLETDFTRDNFLPLFAHCEILSALMGILLVPGREQARSGYVLSRLLSVFLLSLPLRLLPLCRSKTRMFLDCHGTVLSFCLVKAFFPDSRLCALSRPPFLTLARCFPLLVPGRLRGSLFSKHCFISVRCLPRSAFFFLPRECEKDLVLSKLLHFVEGSRPAPFFFPRAWAFTHYY